MKKVLVLLSLVMVLFGCSKEDDRPSTLNISGTITSKANGEAIQDVKVTIKRNSLMSIFIIDDIIYSNTTGKFDYKITPKDGFHYYISIEKSGYVTKEVDVSLDLANQIFNIELETE